MEKIDQSMLAITGKHNSPPSIGNMEEWDYINISLYGSSNVTFEQKKETVYEMPVEYYTEGDSYSFNESATKTYHSFSGDHSGSYMSIYGGDTMREFFKKESLSDIGDEHVLKKQATAADNIAGWGFLQVSDFHHRPDANEESFRFAEPGVDDNHIDRDKLEHYSLDGMLLGQVKQPISKEQEKKEKFFQAGLCTRIHQDSEQESGMRYDMEITNHNLNMAGVINSLYAGGRANVMAAMQTSITFQMLGVSHNTGVNISAIETEKINAVKSFKKYAIHAIDDSGYDGASYRAALRVENGLIKYAYHRKSFQQADVIIKSMQHNMVN